MMQKKFLERRLIHLTYPYVVISLCAAFLFYKYVLQIYPSIITHPLMLEFQLTGAGLGNLAATFYYSFIFAQLFVGFLLDKYSPRWVTSFAILTCAIGTYLFSQTNSLLNAELSRALMGIGVAFATVAYMKLAFAWVHPRQYALVGGLLASAAMAGAVFGEAPLSWMMNALGWRECLFWVAMFGFGLAILFVILVRDEPQARNFCKLPTPHITWQDILDVLKSKQNWMLTLYGGLAFSPIAVFGGLWGNPFIQQAYHVSKTQSATYVSLVFIGLGIGSPLLGMLSNRVNNRRNFMIYCTLISAVAISLVIYCTQMPIVVMALLLFIFGFALGAFVLVFTIGKESNKAYLTATVVAMINASDAILDAITEPAIGKLLDLRWTGEVVDGVHHFSLSSYHWALSILPIYLILGTIVLFAVKEVVSSATLQRSH